MTNLTLLDQGVKIPTIIFYCTFVKIQHAKLGYICGSFSVQPSLPSPCATANVSCSLCSTSDIEKSSWRLLFVCVRQLLYVHSVKTSRG